MPPDFPVLPSSTQQHPQHTLVTDYQPPFVHPSDGDSFSCAERHSNLAHVGFFSIIHRSFHIWGQPGSRANRPKGKSPVNARRSLPHLFTPAVETSEGKSRLWKTEQASAGPTIPCRMRCQKEDRAADGLGGQATDKPQILDAKRLFQSRQGDSPRALKTWRDDSNLESRPTTALWKLSTGSTSVCPAFSTVSTDLRTFSIVKQSMP